jgi:hypothetical protein
MAACRGINFKWIMKLVGNCNLRCCLIIFKVWELNLTCKDLVSSKRKHLIDENAINEVTTNVVVKLNISKGGEGFSLVKLDIP